MKTKAPTIKDLRISFEFFPPRTNSGMEKLALVADKLAATKPEFFSCTYGAGGSTKKGTKDTVAYLSQKGFIVSPHLSIGADGKTAIEDILDEYQAGGINRIVALRGDLPSGIGRNRFAHNAETLVNWIREHSDSHFHIEVGAYPETHPDSKSANEDLQFFKKKIEAGANSAITQYFYSPHAYFDFLERSYAEGIDIPIYPGIMPITNYEGIIKFSDSCGADVPRWIRKRLEDYADDQESLTKFGTEVVTKICDDLITGGAPGLHFYTLNRSVASLAILANLKLAPILN